MDEELKVEDPRVLIAVLALLMYALLSRQLDRWWISMPAAMVLLGVIAGPVGLGLISVGVGSEVVKVTAELTLALMLFHDAVRIDLRALASYYSVPLRLLGIGLPVMIALGTVVAYLVLPQFGLIGAALIATMLAPTDAALGEAVVSDKRIPIHVRQGLNVESGLNDGLSVPIFLVLLGIAADPSAAESGALLHELVRQIGFGLLSGVVIGAGGGALFRLAGARHLMEPVWRRVAILTIAIGCFVGAAALGGSGFIGAFVGGVAFGLASQARAPADGALTAYLGSFFDAMSFFLLGAVVLPFVVDYVTWQIVLYAVLSLIAVRMVSVFVATFRSGAAAPTVVFMGWFGPRGLATLVFTVLLIDEGIPNGAAIATAAAVGVVLSVFAHGVSAPPLVSAYAEWCKRHPRCETALGKDARVREHPTRFATEGATVDVKPKHERAG